ncbi:hypothetical protein Tco_1491185 [Tanacetum coccineum]
MAPNRSKSFYAIKECSTCGSWYTKECCSIGNLNDQIIVPEPDSSLHCAVCGTPVDGPYCHGCTLIRMKFEKDLFTYCVDNGVFQNFQDISESSNDNTNVVNAPREPSVVDQDPGDGGSFRLQGPPKDTIISELERATIKFGLVPLDSKLFHNNNLVVKNGGGLMMDLQYSSGSKYGNATCSNGSYRSYAKLLEEKDQEEKSIVELLAEERLQKDNQALNESQSPQEMRIQDLEIQRASSV